MKKILVEFVKPMLIFICWYMGGSFSIKDELIISTVLIFIGFVIYNYAWSSYEK